MTKPIRPEEISDAKIRHIPAAVFEAFNAEIALCYIAGRAIVKQKAILSRLAKQGHYSNEIFNAGWLNIEEAYRNAGWEVEYDKPGYNESGEAYFTFRKPG